MGRAGSVQRPFRLWTLAPERSQPDGDNVIFAHVRFYYLCKKQ